MRRLLITGAGGMTGVEVTRQAAAADWEVTALSRSELDITDSSAVEAAIMAGRPNVVINAAAYTAVDAAEGARDEVMRVNGDGAGHLARSARAAGAVLVHISTDYVFDGTSGRPYLPSDSPRPLSVYGESKLAGEVVVRNESADHAIVRTSWVYSNSGKNFVRTMLRLAGTPGQIRVVDDQHGSPTSAEDLARALLTVAEASVQGRAIGGVWHFTNSGVTTWCGFARAIFEEKFDTPPEVTPITTQEFPTPAARPPYSVLDTSGLAEAFEITPRPWRIALRDTLERM